MHILEIVLISFLTSSISVGLAFRKYRTEKWWDKKLEVYLQVVEALNKILVYCDRHLDEEYDGIEIGDDEKSQAQKDFHQAKRHIERQANMGRLLFSDAAYKVLISIDGSLHCIEDDSPTEKILEIREKTDDLLSSFIVVAKNDLGAKSVLSSAKLFISEKFDYMKSKIT